MGSRLSSPHVLWLILLSVAASWGCDDVTEVVPTPPAKAVDKWARWCPTDSSKIAYTHLAVTWEEYLQYGPESVWIVDIETGQREHVAEGWAHDWSPEGQEILLARGGSLLLRNLTSGAEETLLECAGGLCGRSRFSPQGGVMTYITSYGAGAGTWLLEPGQAEAAHISAKFASDWSPDGEEIICDSLVIITEAGVRVERIPYSAELGYVGSAAWSPMGSTMTFGANGGIWSISRDGTQEKLLADQGFNPSWSPDGTRLAYDAISADGKGGVIWVMSTDGTGKTQVTDPISYVDSE